MALICRSTIPKCIASMPIFLKAEDGIRDHCVTGVQTCALPISLCGIYRHRLRRTRPALVVHEDRRNFEMKVYSGQSVIKCSRPARFGCYLLLIVGLTFSNLPRPPASVTPPQEKPHNQATKEQRDLNEKIVRQAQKAIRSGKYEDALKIYKDMIDANPQDIVPRLGASFAYLKMQNYVRCFEQATEAINLNKDN